MRGLAKKSPLPAIILLIIALAALLYSQYASSTAYAAVSGRYLGVASYGAADFVLFLAFAGLLALYYGYYKR
ncbi:MAG: hypothetical protein QXU82_02465 [Candidatus Aenigmatarchaeota archaeon]